MTKFEVDKKYRCPALYGGEYVITVTGRTNATIKFLYDCRTSDDRREQTAEIKTQTDCFTGEVTETAVAWEYQPRDYYGRALGDVVHGYYFSNNLVE